MSIEVKCAKKKSLLSDAVFQKEKATAEHCGLLFLRAKICWLISLENS